jgi:protein-disulfide isomerase
MAASPPTTKTRRERRREAREAYRAAPRRAKRSGRRFEFGLGTLTAAGVVGGLAIVALAVALGGAPKSAPSSVELAFAPPGIPAGGFVLGRTDAPVAIDLFEDFQCPACLRWGQTVYPSLVSNELAVGTVKLAFHNLAFLGPESVAAAHAGYAAERQGRFWDMWSTLYANQGHENAGAFSRERLVEIAAGLHLDVARFEADMDSPEAATALAASIAAGDAAGVNSTPTLVIGGKAFTGLQPYPDIAAAIVAAASVGR